MFFTHSIRWRLQIWHGTILLAVLGGFGLTAWRLEQQRTLTTATDRLHERFNTAARLLRQTGPPDGRPRPAPEEAGQPGDRDPPPPRRRPGNFDDPAAPAEVPGAGGPPEMVRFALEAALRADESPGGLVSIWRRDGRLLATTGTDRSIPRPMVKDGADLLTNNGTTLTLLRSTPPGEVIMVSRSIAQEMATLRRNAWQLAGAGAGILALGLTGGWWAAGRALRPIATISATAERLSAGNLNERLSVADTQDELGQLAVTLNHMLGRLDSSFSQQTRFISDAAHELRTPVTVMITQTQSALRRERPAEEYRLSLEACQRAANRMRQLIESLLALARLDAGDQPMKRLRFDLSRAVRDQIELLAPLAAARKITLHGELAPLSMEGDPDYITMVIANLLTNAIHYNRDDGEVRLSLSQEGGVAVLTIADTGEGIAPESLGRIFDRFYRVDQSRSLPAGRTGLGLAITKSIIEAHGGMVTADSTPGIGTTFTVRLPLSIQAGTPAGASP